MSVSPRRLGLIRKPEVGSLSGEAADEPRYTAAEWEAWYQQDKHEPPELETGDSSADQAVDYGFVMPDGAMESTTDTTTVTLIFERHCDKQ